MRSFFRRRSGVITGDLVYSPVASISDLRAVAVQDVDDGQLIYVKGVDRVYGFRRGVTTADDGASVIAPTVNASAGRWKAVTTISEEVTAADVSVADEGDLLTATDVEGALTEIATFMSELALSSLQDTNVGSAVDGDYLVYDQPSTKWKASQKTMIGGSAFTGLSSLNFSGAMQRKVATPQTVPFTTGTRIHVKVSAILNVVGSPSGPPTNLVWIGVNFQDQTSTTGASFISGNLADPSYNNSEVVLDATFIIADATSASTSQRNIIASGMCLQTTSNGTVIQSTIRRLDRTAPPAPAPFDGTGMQVENVGDTFKNLQVSIESNSSSMTLSDHYAIVVKAISVDYSKGS